MTNGIQLICFDLDHTLTLHNSWDILNNALGIDPEDDRQLFQYYREGKITAQEWNDKLLEGYRKHERSTRAGITDILTDHTYMEGAKDVIEYLKGEGYAVVLVSGSMDIMVDMVATELGIEYKKANSTFGFDANDKLISLKNDGDDVTAKLRYLQEFCELLNIRIDECACVGDGANDVKMFQATKRGITFKGSPIEGEAWKVITSLTELKTIF